MKTPTHELLLALRSPTSGWLAAVLCALEEALQDPCFTNQHRELVEQLLHADFVPAPVAAAANDRLMRFEQSINEMHKVLFDPAVKFSHDPADTSATRPKLTLVSNRVQHA